MNIVSTIVGITIMGAAAPSVLQMSIAPVEAQKRAENFAIAESAAVAYAAANEGQEEITGELPENCVAEETELRAFDVTCRGGQGRYLQTVVRSFRLAPEEMGGYTNPMRSFAFETPSQYSHVECPVNDPWGVMYYNDHLKAGHLDACLPAPIWSEARYLESNPDDWLYDLSDHGYGRHPDY